MSGIVIEQSLWTRRRDQPPELRGKSAAYAEEWLEESRRIIEGFGRSRPSVPCPNALFVQPLGKRYVAIVQVADRPGRDGGSDLGFRFLVLDKKPYQTQLGDPLALADRLPPAWEREGELGSITWTDVPLPPRNVTQVQAVLKRVKANALKEGEDPEDPKFERTPENSESPALLGGTQVLVDGGRLWFTRAAPDNDLVRGLWTLLPNRTRGRLYPATFAYSADLEFDVLVLPDTGDPPQGYTGEETACDYPAGSYELSLQSAAEAGDQSGLEAIQNRRDSRETLRLTFILLAGMLLIVILGNLSGLFFSPQAEPDPAVQRAKAAAAAGIVAVQDPWTIIGMLEVGNALWLPKK